ncbi:hypothetical protein SAMN05192568_102136 [Methylobacterium pseudosasicola]|uniref:Uncharacterized protein n=1 Tax=Methylobacterium pseudosasicola TaxID=582667 RepID=A0A1I4NKJ1_9HYPH|nr:hypothetical protein SAMN05192568_102136 [Methylobacterium pseudosasicola]
MTVTEIIALWTVASLPIGVAVGKGIAWSKRHG